MNSSMFRPLLLAGTLVAAAGLVGCVATPVDPYYGGTGYGYGADYGYGGYGYGYPVGTAGFGYYGAAPVVVAPPIGIGIGIGGVFGSGYRGYRGYNGYGGHGGFRPGYGAVKPYPGPAGGGWGVRPNGGGGWGGRGGGGGWGGRGGGGGRR